MNLFPDKYNKPLLLGIVEASTLGWGAACSLGDSPGAGGSICSYGNGAGSSIPVCLPTGGSASKSEGDVYYRTADTKRLFNTDDMGEGF